jgi:DNA-binding LacI/PurR family transcriptional regulator
VGSGQLKYKEVEKEMRQLAQTLPIGAKIPPERHLAITYDCNFLTVRKALKALVDDGIIVRRVGSGSFVAKRESNGHRPHPVAPKDKRVGLLVFHKSNAYAHKLLQGIAHAAMEEEINLRSAWVKDFGADALRQAHHLVQDGCVALVLPWFPHTMNEEVRAFVKKCPVPVCLPLVISGLEKNYFGEPELFGDNLLKLMGDLCGYYRLLGRTQLAFVGPAAAEDPIMQKMLAAYTAYVSENNLPNLARLVPPGSSAMDQLAGQWQPYRGQLGVVCYDDEHALRLMTAMHKIGLEAPEDYGVIGHNDTEASNYSDPPLSTISQDFSDISHSLLKNALALSQGSIFHSGKSTPARLLVRSTCGGRGRIDEALQKQFANLVLHEDTA